MAYISQIKIGSTNYEIKDSVARSSIEALAKGGTHFIGLAKGYSDGVKTGTQSLLNETEFTASCKLIPTSTGSLIRDNTDALKRLKTGDIVSIKDSGNSSEGKEFIFVQTSEQTEGVGTWYELGANLGAFAYANSGTGTIHSNSLNLDVKDVNVLSGNKYVSSIECEKMSQEVVTVGILDPEKVGDGTGGTLNELIGRISWRDNNVPVYANVTDECLNLNTVIMEPDTVDITTKTLSTGYFYEEPLEGHSYASPIDVVKKVNSENASSETVATGGTSTDGGGDEIVTEISSTVTVNPSAS